jgi:hypothetical protein
MFFLAGTQRWAYAVSLGKDEAGKRIRVFLYAKTRGELQSKIMDERTRGGGAIAPRVVDSLGY